MAITKIEFAGGDKTAMTFVTVSRRISSPTITASFLTPQKHYEREASAARTDEIFDLAAHVQQAVDGCHGTNSMIHDYFHLIEQMAD